VEQVSLKPFRPAEADRKVERKKGRQNVRGGSRNSLHGERHRKSKKMRSVRGREGGRDTAGVGNRQGSESLPRGPHGTCRYAVEKTVQGDAGKKKKERKLLTRAV